MKCQQNMEFIEQALIDYSNTLPASARAAFVPVAQQYLTAVIEELSEPDAGTVGVYPQPPAEE
ncbi:hypothetical protein [Microbulbifer taiwanensis]|nr:hypothetical protein [Microbulbifer taiwanensis]